MSWSTLLFLALTVVPTLVWLGALGANLLTVWHVRSLSDVEPGAPGTVAEDGEAVDEDEDEGGLVEPLISGRTLSVVVPACNEEAHLRATVESLLAQSVELEVVVVNDRSTDRTGAVADELAAHDPRITVVHIATLPDGWLGKLHALHQGVQRCRGRWLLFADADVVFAPDALARAIGYAERHQRDLLTAIPRVLSAGWWGDLTLNATGSIMGLATRLWQVPDPESSAVAGVGAFILIRHEAFRKTPGFPWLRLEVADDVGLGLMLKTHGGRCEAVRAVEQLSIQWYHSFSELMHKTQKNFFGILGRFSLGRLAGIVAVFLWLAWFPLALLLPVEASWITWIPWTGLGALTLTTVVSAVWMHRPLLSALFPSLGLTLLAWVMVRAGWRGWRLGGIEWRGVLYPSSELRDKQRVLF